MTENENLAMARYNMSFDYGSFKKINFINTDIILTTMRFMLLQKKDENKIFIFLNLILYFLFEKI